MGEGNEKGSEVGSERQKIVHNLVLENLVEDGQGINVVGRDGTRGAAIGLDPDETLIPTTIQVCRTVSD